MRAVVQRVREAQVRVHGKTVGEIGQGLLVFLGIAHSDEEDDADYLVPKVLDLRIFNDSGGKFNLSLRDSGGSLLVVSQFTLLGDCRKGRRPSFTDAASPENARRLYDYFIASAAEQGVPVSSGAFQAMMDVHLINDGPVTMVLDSKRAF